MTNEIKSIDFDAYGGFQAFLDLTSSGGQGEAVQLARYVPWLSRARAMTAAAVANLPFEIVNEKGDIVDSSDDWKNKVGGMESPKRLLYLVAASLCGGAAYVIPERTSRLIVNLQYCAPHTIQPQITVNGLQWFDRSTDQGKSERVAPDEMIYFWYPDPDVEIGPAKSSLMNAAYASARLIASMEATLDTYSGRGFVPATILAAKGMPTPQEREKAEYWWNRFLRGWDKIAAKIMNADAMDIKQVGAGMEELKGVYSDITRQQIENIGAAFGIPAALFMSSASYATELAGITRAWYSASVFVTLYQTIEETFTDQLLKQWGYRWQFKPESLDAFQEDENEKASSFATYVSAKVKPSIVAEMLGVELPPGYNYSDLDPEEPEPQPIQIQQDAQATQEPQGQATEELPQALDAEQVKELALWQQIAVRNFGKGKGKAVDFECKHLPAGFAESIRAALELASTTESVKAAFSTRQRSDILALAEAINRLADGHS